MSSSSPMGAYSMLGQLRSEAERKRGMTQWDQIKDFEIERRETAEKREDRSGLTGLLSTIGTIGGGLLATALLGPAASPFLVGLGSGLGSWGGSKIAGSQYNIKKGKWNIEEDEDIEDAYAESQISSAVSDAITSGLVQSAALKAGGWKEFLGIEGKGAVVDAGMENIRDKMMQTAGEGLKYVPKEGIKSASTKNLLQKGLGGTAKERWADFITKQPVTKAVPASTKNLLRKIPFENRLLDFISRTGVDANTALGGYYE